MDSLDILMLQASRKQLSATLYLKLASKLLTLYPPIMVYINNIIHARKYFTVEHDNFYKCVVPLAHALVFSTIAQLRLYDNQVICSYRRGNEVILFGEIDFTVRSRYC